MSFLEEYKQKLVSADEAVKIVKSGDWVDYGWCTGTPDALDKALARRTDELKDVNVRGGILLKPLAIFEREDAGEHFTWNSWHMGGYERKLIKRGCSFYSPIRYSELPRYYRDSTTPDDVAMFQVAPMDSHGYSTLVLTHLTSVLYARLQRKSSLRSMKTCLAVTAVQKPMYIFHRFLTLLRVTTLQSESLVPVVLQRCRQEGCRAYR